MAERRPLQFATLDEAIADAESLLAKGYEPLGKLDLAQVCGHLTAWLNYPLDGYPPLELHARPFYWLVKITVGHRILDEVLAKNAMPSVTTSAPQSIPAPGGDPAKAIRDYADSAARWLNSAGAVPASPLFGVQPKDKITHLQRVHAANHLSFLIPKQ